VGRHFDPGYVDRGSLEEIYISLSERCTGFPFAAGPPSKPLIIVINCTCFDLVAHAPAYSLDDGIYFSADLAMGAQVRVIGWYRSPFSVKFLSITPNDKPISYSSIALP